MKGDIAQRRQLRAVGKTDISKFNLAPHVPFKFSPVLRFRWFVNNFEDTLARGASSLDQLVELMQFADWLVEKSCEHKKCDETAERNRAAQLRLGSDPDSKQAAERPDEIHRRIINSPYAHDDERGAA